MKNSYKIEFAIESEKEYNIHDLVVLKIGRRNREILETTVDEEKTSLSVKIKDNDATYCVVNRMLYESSKDDTDCIQKTNNGQFPFSRKKTAKNKVDVLKKKLANQVKKDQGPKRFVRIYSPEKSVDIILKYDNSISAASIKYGINKAMIQATLFRELTCIDLGDLLADFSVENYYYNKKQIEDYLKKKIIFNKL